MSATRRWSRPGGKLQAGPRRARSRRASPARSSRSRERRTRIVRLHAGAPIADEAAIERARPHPAAAVHRARRRGRRTSSGTRRCTPARRARSPRRRPGCTSRPSCSRALDARGVRARRRPAARRCGHLQAGGGRRSRRARDARGVVRDSRRDRARRSTRRARAGGRVWAVGTTSVRTLESAADARRDGARRRGRDAHLHPAAVRASASSTTLVTNFHLPRSTLIMLVAAFAGYDLTMRAYRRGDRRAVPLLLVRRRDGDRMSFGFRLEATEGAARAGVSHTPHGVVRDARLHGGGHAGDGQGARPRRPARDGRADDPRQRLPPAPAARATSWCASWAGCTGSCSGTARSSPTPAASRCSRWRGCARIERGRRRVPQPHRRLAPPLHPGERDADRAQPRRRRDHAVRPRDPGAERRGRPRATRASAACAGSRAAAPSSSGCSARTPIRRPRRAGALSHRAGGHSRRPARARRRARSATWATGRDTASAGSPSGEAEAGHVRACSRWCDDDAARRPPALPDGRRLPGGPRRGGAPRRRPVRLRGADADGAQRRRLHHATAG